MPRWGRDRIGTSTVGQCHGSPQNLQPVTLIYVKPPVNSVINMKLIIQTTVTIAAQGLVIAPVTNDTVIQTRGAQVIKMCTVTIGAGTQVEGPQETLWIKLVRTIAAEVVGRASLACSDRALSQVGDSRLIC